MGKKRGRDVRAFVMLGVVGAVASLGCESDPAGPILQVEGTFGGAWTFDVFIEGVFASRTTCPGTVTLAGQSGRTFGGGFIVDDEGDCAGITPISGEILEGAVRADGGVNFLASRIPVVGPGVAGCGVLVDPEEGGEFNGALNAGELSVLTIVGLDCGDRGQGSAQISMTGTR